MGISILAGRRSNVVTIGSALSTISGSATIYNVSYIVGDLSIIEGSFGGTALMLADIIGPVSVLSGDMHGCMVTIGDIEAEVSTLSDFVFDGNIVASSNSVVIEDDLPGIEGAFHCGSTIASEMSLLDGEFVGTVPVLGRIEHTGMLAEGTMYGSAEIDFTSILLTGDMRAVVPNVGQISGESKLSILAGDFSAVVPIGGDIIGDLNLLSGSFLAHTDTSGCVSGTLRTLSGSLHAHTETNADIVGPLGTVSGSFVALLSTLGSIEGDLSVLRPTYGLQDEEPYDYGVLRFIRGQTR